MSIDLNRLRIPQFVGWQDHHVMIIMLVMTVLDADVSCSRVMPILRFAFLEPDRQNEEAKGYLGAFRLIEWPCAIARKAAQDLLDLELVNSPQSLDDRMETEVVKTTCSCFLSAEQFPHSFILNCSFPSAVCYFAKVDGINSNHICSRSS